VKAAKFDLDVPVSLKNALLGLRADTLISKVIAGSQSLGPMLNLRLVRPNCLFDISSISDLRDVTIDHGKIRIGACVTHAEIEDGVFAALRDHPWQHVAATIAYRSVRNRGTVGGSIAHADPAADWILAATAMNAEVQIVRLDQTDNSLMGRIVPMNKFMLAAYTTALEETEIIHQIILPQPSINSCWGYYKFCRKVGEFAQASSAVYFDEVNKIANIAIGALDGPPKLLGSLAKKILESSWNQKNRIDKLDIIQAEVSNVLADRDTADQKMYVTAINRALNKAFNREGDHE